MVRGFVTLTYSTHWRSALSIPLLLLVWASDARAEAELDHEIALGLTGVYDTEYDRGLHYGLSYELSWSVLRASAMLTFGDTDPRSEQHWAFGLGVHPWRSFHLDFRFHHRTFPGVDFGDNLIVIRGGIDWRGFEIAGGWVLRFPILSPDQIHSPFVFDKALFEHFLHFRMGYQYRFRNGLGLGVLMSTFSRFELHNFDYPQFALVVSYEHPRVGRFRLDAGVGIAGFFNQGSALDRGFLRLEYVRAVGQRARQRLRRRQTESSR